MGPTFALTCKGVLSLRTLKHEVISIQESGLGYQLTEEAMISHQSLAKG